MPIGRIISRGKIVTVSILDLSAPIFTVDVDRYVTELRSVSRAHHHRAHIQLRVAAVLRFVDTRSADLSHLNSRTGRSNHLIGVASSQGVRKSLLQFRQAKLKARRRRTQVGVVFDEGSISRPNE